MRKPSHRAYVVSTPKTEGEKGYWREIGVVWKHKTSNGFDIVVHEGISVHGPLQGRAGACIMDEHSRKSGSENRQRTKTAIARLTPAEREQVEQDADRAGLALGSYMRARLFAGNQPRAVRKPPIDRKALAQFLAWLGRLNGNVYQISRAANFNEPYDPRELKRVLAEITEMRNAVIAALGREAV